MKNKLLIPAFTIVDLEDGSFGVTLVDWTTESDVLPDLAEFATKEGALAFVSEQQARQKPALTVIEGGRTL